MEKPHRNISRCIDRFSNHDLTSHYIISEFAPIGDLFRVLHRLSPDGQEIVWQPLKPQYCRHFIRGIANGISHLHSLGISHGDLKLENILVGWRQPPLNPQYESYRISQFMSMVPKLTDFNNSDMGIPGRKYCP